MAPAASRKSVVAAARKHGKAAGILLHDPARMGLTIDEGFTFIAVGSDGGAVAAGLRTFLETSRQGMTESKTKK